MYHKGRRRTKKIMRQCTIPLEYIYNKKYKKELPIQSTDFNAIASPRFTGAPIPSPSVHVTFEQ